MTSEPAHGDNLQGRDNLTCVEVPGGLGGPCAGRNRGVCPPPRRPSFANYEREISLAEKFARWAAEGEPQFAFVFGYSGLGKSSLARPLCWDLNSDGMRFQLFTVNCLGVVEMDEERARRALSTILTQILTYRDAPQIVVLDEIDCLTPRGRRTTECFWTMDLLKAIRAIKLPALVLGATNYPVSTEDVVQAEINGSIHIDSAPAEVLEGVIADEVPSLDPDVARAVIRQYVQTAPSRLMSTRPFEQAVKAFNRVPDGWAREPVRIAELLHNLGLQPTVAQVDEWEKTNERWITASKKQKDLFLGPGLP